jgi:hypothetical protein
LFSAGNTVATPVGAALESGGRIPLGSPKTA